MKKLMELAGEEVVAEQATVSHPEITVETTEMEFSGLSFLTAKPQDDGTIRLACLYMYHNGTSFRFSGETAEEFKDAIAEFGKELGINGVFSVDGEVECAQAGGMSVILEMVEGSTIRAKEWVNSKKGTVEYAYQLHKGHITGAFAIKKRAVSFGRKLKEELRWFGRE